MKKLIKVLNADMKSPFKHMPYEINKKYTCEEFDDDRNISCSNGFYATDWDGLCYSYRNGKRIFECAVSGKSVEYGQFKRRYEHIELLREISIEEAKEALKKISNDGIDYYHASFPVNPLSGNAKNVTEREIQLLHEWRFVSTSVSTSVSDSLWGSIRSSVWGSIRDFVCDSVWGSIRDSFRASGWSSSWASVCDSVWGYISSLFPKIEKWKHIDHEKGKNPFQPCVDLWNSGFVPSFDGKTWRLHSGENAKVVYEEIDE
jgi:hypothetical protein